ncbi:MAG: NUDIX domain-containing protein [Thermoplasmatota archaeon]
MTSAPTSATKTKGTADIILDDAHNGHTRVREYTIVVATRPASGSKEFVMVRHRERGWELPGGKIEPGEGPVHCALREFREETGHLLAAPHFVAKLHKANGTCYIFTGALGAPAEGKVEPSTEFIEEWRWFPRLPRSEKLGFPEDPYEEMGRLLDLDFG